MAAFSERFPGAILQFEVSVRKLLPPALADVSVCALTGLFQ